MQVNDTYCAHTFSQLIRKRLMIRRSLYERRILYIMINDNNYNGDNNYILLLPVVDDSPPSGGLAKLDPVLITNLVRVLWLLLDRTIKINK